MSKKSKEEIYKIRENEYLEYIKTHDIIEKDARFTDGTLIDNFSKIYRIRLEKIDEAQEYNKKIIEKNREQLKKCIDKLNQKEQEIISNIKDLPKEFYSLSQIDKMIFYRNCFFTPITKKELYTIDNITISIETLEIIQNLYFIYYATYPEKEYFNKNDITKEEINETELEKLRYLNSFCSNAKWQKSKIETLEQRYNLSALELKNLAIKYRYGSLNPKTRKIYGFKKAPKREITNYIINQIFNYTNEEIINTKHPTTPKDRNAYLNYEQSDKEPWLKLELLEGLPPSEKAKIIINIETKTNIYIRYQNELKKANSKEKIKKISDGQIKEATDYVILFLEEEPKNIKKFCKKHDITEYRFKKLIETTKEHNKSLYEEFNKFIKNQQKEQLKQAKNAITTILKNKNNENFTIFDYYEQTNIDVENLKTFLSQFDLEKIDDRIIRTFINEHSFNRPLTQKEKHNHIETVHTLRDKNGILHTPSKEEKEKIINYLEEHNKPSKTTYIIALNRYINGELNLEKQTNRKK